MKILIVDDSKAMRMIVRRTLRQAGFGGHAVDEAASASEALETIHKELPDLVLSDWNMPGMTGLQLLETLTEQARPLKFGFVTSEGTPEMREKAMAAGAVFLITKPFTPEAFQSALQPILGA